MVFKVAYPAPYTANVDRRVSSVHLMVKEMKIHGSLGALVLRSGDSMRGNSTGHVFMRNTLSKLNKPRFSNCMLIAIILAKLLRFLNMDFI